MKSTSSIGKIGIAISVFAISLLVSSTDASAQEHSCTCNHGDDNVSVAPVAVRRATRQYNSNRSYPAKTKTRVYVTNSYNGTYRSAVDADYYDTRRIASDYGHQDGFYDGRQAGMERDTYHPENSGDYKKATNGYEDDFGPKNVYRQAYRNAYLRGYKSGWKSVAQRHTYGAVRW